MKILRVSLIIGVILLTLFALPVNATAILHEYWNTGGDADSQHIYGANIVAEQFTSEATAHSITAISVEILRVGTPNYIYIELWNAAAGVPTTKIDSAVLLGTSLSTSYTKYTVIFPTYSTLPSTQYVVVVSCPGGDVANYVEWHQDSGGGLASAVGLHSTNTGISWTSDTPADYLFEIFGGVVFQVVSANVFESYSVSGDWLITINTINDYPNYSGVTNPAQYFNVQLLDGGNIIAATTLKSYGDSVCSIYLSPTSVSALTYGSGYIIKMVGSFAGTPSTTYTLQHTASNNDWQGSDLRYLDQWCLTTAKSMNTYDGNLSTNPYTTKTSSGTILTTYGGSAFVLGIPNIMDIRPSLFQTSMQSPNYDVGTATNAYDNAFTWQAQVGSTIASDATAWSNVLGISAKQVLAIGIWAFYIIAILFTFTSKQGAETAFVLIICVPVLFIGMNYRIIEIQTVLVATALLVLLFVVKMVFTK